MAGKELIEDYKATQWTNARNSMGCSENWYNEVFAIYNTFSEEEILNMSEREIELLMRLGLKMSEALY